MPNITEKENIYVSAVIVSAGNSTRMGGINKQFLEINNMPVIAHTIKAFDNLDAINEIVVVTRECDIADVVSLIEKYNFKKVSSVVSGGETRQLSVYNGVINTSHSADYVAIHDGARPLVSDSVIINTLNNAFEFDAAATGVKVKDTVKVVDVNDNIVDTPDRTYMRFIQTPQIFDADLITSALVKATRDNTPITDDCSAVEYIGFTVKTVEGDERNIKVTTPMDLKIAEILLEETR